MNATLSRYTVHIFLFKNIFIMGFILAISLMGIHFVLCKLYKVINSSYTAPVRWLSWLGHHPKYQKVVGSTPGQGTYLGYGFNLQ